MGKTKTRVMGATALSLGLLAAGCGSSSPPPITANGTIQVSINEADNIGAPGSAVNPFENGGAVQVVTDSGKVLAAAPVTPSANAGQAEGSDAVLNYQFRVTVPAGQPQYGIRLSGVPGTVWESASEMRHPALSVTVG